MSLENSIAALTTQAGLLLDLPQSIANTATTQITRVGNDYAARVATLAVTRYVDPVLGSDTANNGVVGSPYKTIQRALEDCVPGGAIDILLMGDITISGSDVYIRNKIVRIVSDSSTRRVITFERYLVQTVTPNQRGSRNFNFYQSALLILENIRLNAPVLDGSWGNYTNASGYGSMFWAPSGRGGRFTVCFANVELEISATPFGTVFATGVWTIFANGLTASNQALPGRLIANYTNTAGTVPGADLHTNLATV